MVGAYKKKEEKKLEKVTEGNILTISIKREIDWAEYLDYTNFEAGETNNIALELFTNDFCGKSE